MRCQACRRELPNLEPVYRIRVGYGSMWTTPFGSSVGSVCNKCEAEQFTYQYLANDGVGRLMRNRWLSAKPCCHCQRPVFVDRHQRGLRFFVCGTECRKAMYANARRRTPKQATCVVCKKRFLPKSHAEYCSNACRQRAYRLRSTG
jgi:hypothetical protein